MAEPGNESVEVMVRDAQLLDAYDTDHVVLVIIGGVPELGYDFVVEFDWEAEEWWN